MFELASRFVKDQSGVAAIEYGLIAAGISVAMIASVNSLGTNLNAAFSRISTHQAGQQAAQQVAASRGQLAARQAAREHADDARCRQNRGAPGSNAYLACRMNMANNRHADLAQAEANPGTPISR